MARQGSLAEGRSRHDRKALPAIFLPSLLAGTAIARSARAGEQLTVATGGGIIADAERAAFFVPTAKALGVTFKEETIQNLRDIRVQVQSNAVTWDLAQLGLDECQLAAKEGHAREDRPQRRQHGRDRSPADMDYCIPAYYYSTVLAWNTKTGQPGGKTMKTWADFFDAEEFPGARSVYKYPRGNLEMALLADGVAPDKLYPLDVERAFEKLEQLKPEIQAWWDSGAQSAQLLKDEEVDYIQIWNGRASSVIRDGGKAGFTFNQGIMTADTFVIPRARRTRHRHEGARDVPSRRSSRHTSR